MPTFNPPTCPKPEEQAHCTPQLPEPQVRICYNIGDLICPPELGAQFAIENIGGVTAFSPITPFELTGAGVAAALCADAAALQVITDKIDTVLTDEQVNAAVTQETVLGHINVAPRITGAGTAADPFTVAVQDASETPYPAPLTGPVTGTENVDDALDALNTCAQDNKDRLDVLEALVDNTLDTFYVGTTNADPSDGIKTLNFEVRDQDGVVTRTYSIDIPDSTELPDATLATVYNSTTNADPADGIITLNFDQVDELGNVVSTFTVDVPDSTELPDIDTDTQLVYTSTTNADPSDGFKELTFNVLDIDSNVIGTQVIPVPDSTELADLDTRLTYNNTTDADPADGIKTINFNVIDQDGNVVGTESFDVPDSTELPDLDQQVIQSTDGSLVITPTTQTSGQVDYDISTDAIEAPEETGDITSGGATLAAGKEYQGKLCGGRQYGETTEDGGFVQYMGTRVETSGGEILSAIINYDMVAHDDNSILFSPEVSTNLPSDPCRDMVYNVRLGLRASHNSRNIDDGQNHLRWRLRGDLGGGTLTNRINTVGTAVVGNSRSPNGSAPGNYYYWRDFTVTVPAGSAPVPIRADAGVFITANERSNIDEWLADPDNPSPADTFIEAAPRASIYYYGVSDW